MNIPEPLLIGYLPKKVAKRPEWLNNPDVEEICSISEHVSELPTNYWLNKILSKHNDWGLFDSEEIALSLFDETSVGFEVFAYRLFPLEFDEGKVTPVELKARLEDDLGNFIFLGFDSANEIDHHFDCSALSCTSGATVFPVNRYCLFGDINIAYDATIIFSQGHYEPGPYYILEVYRKKKLV
jgi:hypothetical protein